MIHFLFWPRSVIVFASGWVRSTGKGISQAVRFFLWTWNYPNIAKMHLTGYDKQTIDALCDRYERKKPCPVAPRKIVAREMYMRLDGSPWGMLCDRMEDGTLIPVGFSKPWIPDDQWYRTAVEQSPFDEATK
jgi:hypothetical protein